ncbi:MAG TPA: IPTL-CTERM sorting domain-containing protein [Usitatibacteraceae bacterium]|nr:IPTL-CTERM sorting domain-containing protein [Usitatibacteraceae bacterium]
MHGLPSRTVHGDSRRYNQERSPPSHESLLPPDSPGFGALLRHIEALLLLVGLGLLAAAAQAQQDIAVFKTHAGDFAQGQVGAAFTVTVTNVGGAPTPGVVTVTDDVPAGLTPTAAAGAGWVCNIAGAAVTCSRSDALAPGASYPPITVIVNVAPTAPASVTNTATASVGGDVDATNNSSSDVATILPGPDLTISKSHASSFLQGQVGAAFTVTVSNGGGIPTSGAVTVTDNVPAGLTPTAAAGAGWVCNVAGASVTRVRSDPLAPGASYGPITLTVNVAPDAPPSVTNTAIASGGGDVNAANNTASDVATIVPALSAVTPSAGANGSIAPATPQSVASGGTFIFTVTPDPGYTASVGGTCGGTLAGTTYTTNPITTPCTVVASFSVIPITTFTGPSPTGTGPITATLTGGGAACSFAASQFIPLTGHPRSPPAGSAPAAIDFPHGLFDFTTTGCTPASTITITASYPQLLPPGTQYWKYGPTPMDPAPHWYVLPAAIAGNTATFTITDGTLGDDDLAANGTIVDQGGPGFPLGANQIPTLSEWAMLLLASLMLIAGMRAPRRRA